MAQTGVIENGTRAVSKAPERSMASSVFRIRLLTVIGMLVAWEGVSALGRMGVLYGDVLPSSLSIVQAIGEELVTPGFYKDLGATSIAHSLGFSIGAMIALVLGIMMGSNTVLRGALEPYLNAIGSTPKIIFLPILFLAFGTGIESKIAKGALSAFFPVVFSTVLGMLLIPKVLLKVGHSFNLSTWQMVRKIYLPAMMNPVITGLRLAVAITVIGVLVAELKFADAGLGYRVGIYYEQFQIAPMYAIILIIFAIAAALNVMMTMVQDRVNRHMAPAVAKGKTHVKLSGGLG